MEIKDAIECWVQLRDEIFEIDKDLSDGDVMMIALILAGDLKI